MVTMKVRSRGVVVTMVTMKRGPEGGLERECYLVLNNVL